MIGGLSEDQDNEAPQFAQNRLVAKFVRPHFAQVRDVDTPVGGRGGGYIGANAGTVENNGPFMARAAIVTASPTIRTTAMAKVIV